MSTRLFLLAVFLVANTVCIVSAKDVEPYNHSPVGTLTGELAEWHKITLGWDYAPADSSTTSSENDNQDNPFFNYRLDVTFSHSSEDVPSYVVPGYFAADGNSANTGATSGNVWLCHFVPSTVGTWTWQASFVQGLNVSAGLTTSGTPVGFDGTQGSFEVIASNKMGLDLRSKGRLEYVGQRYLQFAGNGDFFFKSGVASPDNILACSDFDGTVIGTTNTSAKAWLPHQQDYRPGDPTWAGGKGTGLIGAINYLSDVGMNAISVKTLTLLGDDGTISPFADEVVQYYDVSKLAQWQIVFDHATTMGLHIQVVTQDQKNDQLLNGGSLGPERAVYYRELVARLGHHLALTWNLGEDNTNFDEQRKSYIDYISAIDPYRHPIAIHSFAIGKNSTYTPLLNYPSLSGISLQSRATSAGMEALEWVQASTDSGRPWVVCNDEQNPSNIGVAPDAVVSDNHASIRISFLWGILMAGGAGIEYYFGTSTDESDLTCQDFRSREGMFIQSRYALDFLESADVPSLNTLSNANNLVDEGTWALSDTSGTTFIIYLPNGGSTNIDVSALAGSTFSVSWYNPRSGENFTGNTMTSIVAGPTNTTSIGEPPYDTSMDWVVLLVCEDCVGGEDSEGGVRSALPSSAPMMAPFTPLSATPIVTPSASLLDTPSIAPTSMAPMMAPFIPLSAAPIVSPTTSLLVTPSIAPTSMTPMMAPFIPLSVTPVASIAAGGAPSAAPTSVTPTQMAPFTPLSPDPISPGENSALVLRTSPLILLSSSPVSSNEQENVYQYQATSSPTSATPIMAPFIPLSASPVSSSTGESAYQPRRGTTSSPTSATPIMAPFIPLSGPSSIAPMSEAPAMAPFCPLTGNPVATSALLNSAVLSKPVHPQWKLTPLSLLLASYTTPTQSPMTLTTTMANPPTDQSSRSNTTTIGTVPDERNVSSAKSYTSSVPSSGPSTNFESLWNQVVMMRAPQTESKATVSASVQTSSESASRTGPRPKQLRQVSRKP